MTRRWVVGAGLVALFLLAVEGSLLVLAPIPVLCPGLMPSERYGRVPFASMTHTLPGEWQFIYPVQDGVRGGIPDSVCVTVLGDSYAFGVGSDLSFADLLPGCLNLSIPNSGLVQAVLRYQDHKPSPLVIIQYYHNDPRDTVRDRAYLAGPQLTGALDRFLARTPLRGLQLWSRIRIRRKPGPVKDDGGVFYCDLLDSFVRGVDARVLFLTDARWLRVYPAVENRVRYLESQGLLEVVDVGPIVPIYCRSPEGHKWNTAAHRAIGEELLRLDRQ